MWWTVKSRSVDFQGQPISAVGGSPGLCQAVPQGAEGGPATLCQNLRYFTEVRVFSHVTKIRRHLVISQLGMHFSSNIKLSLNNYRQAEIHRTSDIDEETSQCPVNVVKTPDKMSYVLNVQPLKL